MNLGIVGTLAVIGGFLVGSLTTNVALGKDRHMRLLGGLLAVDIVALAVVGVGWK